MNVTFDPAKRGAMLVERGLDFVDAAQVFEDVTLDAEDDRPDYGERQIITVGYLRGRMVIVLWTPRGDAHVISMRKANERERRRYRQRLGEG